MPETKHPEVPTRILLGGGIGSGKSVAGRRLEQLGVTVVDADCLGHAVLESDGEAFRSVSDRWPSVVVNYRIDRGVLADIVFADSEQLDELEALTHPAIVRRISEIASEAETLVVEIPIILHVPGSWIKVFIDTDEDARVRRAVERGSTEIDVRSRMASQSGRAEWMRWAGKTIENNGSMEDLVTLIDSLWYGLRTTDYGLPS